MKRIIVNLKSAGNHRSEKMLTQFVRGCDDGDWAQNLGADGTVQNSRLGSFSPIPLWNSIRCLAICLVLMSDIGCQSFIKAKAKSKEISRDKFSCGEKIPGRMP